MKKRMKKTDNRGFSLIELVIVVSIMAILTVSISIVASHFIRKARIQAQPCNFHDDKVRVIVVYTDKGVIRVEYFQYPGIMTTIENGIKVKTEVYSSENIVKFSHVN